MIRAGMHNGLHASPRADPLNAAACMQVRLQILRPDNYPEQAAENSFLQLFKILANL